MKFATLPFCAVAFAFLSVAHVVLAHYGLITFSPVLLTLTSYSALIAGAAWFDRRPVKSAINYGGAHGVGSLVSLGHASPRWDGWAPDAGLPDVLPASYLAAHHLILASTSLRMTAAFQRDQKS